MISGEPEISGQSDSERIHLANTVGRFLSCEPDDHRRQSVEDLARALAHDLCLDVREALAAEVRACRFLPGDLAETIARDVEDISLPFLAECPALSDRLLEQIVRDASEAARVAIAGREILSEPVSFAISEAGGEESVAHLVENEGADMSSRIFAGVMQRFDGNEEIMEKVSNRPDLTLKVVDLLIRRITEVKGEHLIQRYGLAQDYAAYVAGQARRRALHKIFAGASDGEVEAYLRRLQRIGELTSDIILQFLEDGQPGFFQIAMAIRANVSKSNIDVLLRDGGTAGFNRMLAKTGIESDLHPLMRTAYTEYRKGLPQEAQSAPSALI